MDNAEAAKGLEAAETLARRLAVILADFDHSPAIMGMAISRLTAAWLLQFPPEGRQEALNAYAATLAAIVDEVAPRVDAIAEAGGLN